jgi:hypothetical protein
MRLRSVRPSATLDDISTRLYTFSHSDTEESIWNTRAVWFSLPHRRHTTNQRICQKSFASRVAFDLGRTCSQIQPTASTRRRE